MGNQSVACARKEIRLSNGLGLTGCFEMRSGGDIEGQGLANKSWGKMSREEHIQRPKLGSAWHHKEPKGG